MPPSQSAEGGCFDKGPVFKNIISWLSWFPWFSWYLEVLEFEKGLFSNYDLVVSVVLVVSMVLVVSSAKNEPTPS